MRSASAAAAITARTWRKPFSSRRIISGWRAAFPQALQAAQPAKGSVGWIEIEVTNFDELRDALDHTPDVILLDNMNPAQVRQAVEQVRRAEGARKIRIEASGGIALANVREFAEAGVDWISVGALTHSAPAVDLSFEIEPA